jgi:D-amino-acid dehydrogenase
MPSQRRVVIVGAGIVGLCTAYYCRRRGFDVTVIDGRPARRDGCSFGNAGMVVPSHFVPMAAPGMVAMGLKWMWDPRSPFYIKPRLSWDLLAWGVRFWRASTRARVERAAPVLRDLHLASRALYEELAAEPGADFGFAPQGLMMLCKTPHGLAEEAAAASHARRLGVPADVLDAVGVAAREPGLAADVAGGVYYPRDCHLSPDRLMAWLERSLAAAGCRFLWETAVTGFDVADGRTARVRTASAAHVATTARVEDGPAGEAAELGDSVEADEVVLAGGIGSPAVACHLGLRLPMQAGKGYSLTLEAPRAKPAACAILTEARVAVTPMGDTLRFGGTMEMAGLDESVTPARVAGIVAAVPRYYPAFQADDFANVRPWAGLRPCPPDGMPYLGRTKWYRNVTVAAGHGMMGVSLAPVTGRVVADLLAGDRKAADATSPPPDLSLLSPDRFG